MKIQKDEKIMVTGASGLVGTAFIEYLKEQGYENIVAVTRKNCDLLDQKQTLAFIQDCKPHYIFHFAARVFGIMGNMANKGLSFYENAMINLNVIHGAKLADIKKITVMGSACVYPDPPPKYPLTEEMIFMGRPHESENSYAQAKRLMLSMCEAYEESYNLQWAYIVSCNLYGPNDTFDTAFGHVVPSLIKKFYDAKKTGGKVVVWGDGSAQRDFLYVKDTARATLAIMENISGPINIGSSEVYSIRQIAEMIAKISSMEAEDAITWDAEKPNGQAYRGYDLAKLDAIGFQKKWSIEQGLKETWDWYCEHKG